MRLLTPPVGGHLDDVDAARDLAAHRPAAIVGAVAGAARLPEHVVEFLAKAERIVHVTGSSSKAPCRRRRCAGRSPSRGRSHRAGRG
jgi:hypothetical protein